MMNENLFNSLIDLINYYVKKINDKEINEDECNLLISLLKIFYFEYFVCK